MLEAVISVFSVALLGIVIYAIVSFFKYKHQKSKLENLMKKYEEMDFEKFELDSARIFHISEKNLEYQNLFWEIDEMKKEIYSFHGEMVGKNYDFKQENKKWNLKQINKEIKRIQNDASVLEDLIEKFNNKSQNIITDIRTLYDEFSIYDSKLRFILNKFEDSKEKEKYVKFQKEIEKITSEIIKHKDDFTEHVGKMNRKEALESIFHFKENIIKLSNIARYAVNFQNFIDNHLIVQINNLKKSLERNSKEGIFLRSVSTNESLLKIDDLYILLKKAMDDCDIERAKELIKEIIISIETSHFEIKKEKASFAFYYQKMPEIEKILSSFRRNFSKAKKETEKIEEERLKDLIFPLEVEKELSVFELTSTYREEIKKQFLEINEILEESKTEGISFLRKAHLLTNALLLLKSVESNINQILKINYTNSNEAISNQKYFQNLEKIYMESFYELKIKKIILSDSELRAINNIEKFKDIFIKTLNLSSGKNEYDNLAARVNNFFLHVKNFTSSANLKLIKVFMIDEILKEYAYKIHSDKEWNKLSLELEKNRLKGDYDEAIDNLVSFFRSKTLKGKVS